MSKPKILVTGATGKTGIPVVEQLLGLKYPVRALVHRLDERSKRFEKLGAEVFKGNFLDLQSLRVAMQGITRAYFCYPARDGLLEATANIAIASSDAGLEALVNMSQISAREQSASTLARYHWLSEQMLDWANIGASHIRPTFFAEDLYLFSGRSIAEEGKLLLPFGDGKHAPVAAKDIARVVAGILESPESHTGKRYILTGVKEMAMAEAAEAISKALGKFIFYVNLPIETWRQALIEKAGFPEFLANHLAAVARDHQDGVFSGETDVVEKIGGQPPQTLEAFVRENAAKFSDK